MFALTFRPHVKRSIMNHPSAFVGLAVMIAGIPVPAWLSSLMNGAQQEKMKAVLYTFKTTQSFALTVLVADRRPRAKCHGK